jgi:isoquinoline 1-oxidoreductase beta subunit
MAVLRLRNSIIGHVAEVSKSEDGGIKLEKITAVIDCGIVVNPAIVRQQVEGAIIMGLSSSFKKEITISQGKVDQQNYDTYPVLSISETPKIEVNIMKNNEEPGGVGEVGMPGVAPAVVNAISDLTGHRIRKLPYDLTSAYPTG